MPFPEPSPAPMDGFSMILQAEVPPGETVLVTSEDNEIWAGGAQAFFPRHLIYVGTPGLWISAAVDGIYCDCVLWLPLDSYVPGCPQVINWPVLSPAHHLFCSVRSQSDKAGRFLVRFSGEEWRQK